MRDQVSPTDEYVLDTPTVRAFVADARSAVADSASPAAAIGAIHPAFSRLLADREWLPARYRVPAPEGAPAGSDSGSCSDPPDATCLSSRSWCPPVPRPPSTTTSPLSQVYTWASRRRQSTPGYLIGTLVGAVEELSVKLHCTVYPGDLYALLPPESYVHRVRTTSPGTSVSVHLFANDTGCVWRHTYDPATGRVSLFRSGYVNRPCDPGGR